MVELLTFALWPLTIGIVLIVFIILYRKRRRDYRKLHLPWVLLIAFRQQDAKSRKAVSRIQNQLLVKLDRDYTLKPSSLFQLIADSIEQTGRAYFPDQKWPVRQLTLKQLNDLTARIVSRLQVLFETFPFSLAASVDVAAVQSIKDGAKVLWENPVVRGVMDSPAGPLLKKIPFVKIGNAIRLGRKVLTPTGAVLEAGKQIGMESFKRLLLREIAGIVSRESIKTFSGGEVYQDRQRAAVLAIWLAGELNRKDDQQGAEYYQWVLNTVSGIKNKPGVLLRYFLGDLSSESGRQNTMEREVNARYRQAAARLGRRKSKMPARWKAFFSLESLDAISELKSEAIFSELLNSLNVALPAESPAKSKLVSLLQK